MNEKQIEDWRRILSTTVGAYAYIMPVEEIEAARDKIQQTVDKHEVSKESTEDKP